MRVTGTLSKVGSIRKLTKILCNFGNKTAVNHALKEEDNTSDLINTEI